MTGEIAGRYSLDYRKAEMRLICTSVQSGKSLGFVGVSGVGKSNLVNFLREDGLRAAGYLDQSSPPVHFALVDGGLLEGTAGSLWRQMLSALAQLKDMPPMPDDVVLPLLEDTRNQRGIHAWLQKICHEMRHHVVFILDHFDRVIETGPLSMLEELSALRNEGNRERLSYLLFTNRLPHVLGRKHDLETGSKFYDMFRRDIYALEPHTPEDALRELSHLNQGAHDALSDHDHRKIHALAGGHSRLLKVIFDEWLERRRAGSKPPTNVADFDGHHEVSETCRRLLLCLHEQEQEVLLRAAQGALLPEDADTADHLVRRGLLQTVEPLKLFSPVMARFLATSAGEEGGA